MQVKGLNSSEYYWKMQIQKSLTEESSGMASTVKGSSNISTAFHSMMDSYINSEDVEAISESWTPVYADMDAESDSFNMMPLVMMQVEASDGMPDSVLPGLVGELGALEQEAASA